MLFRINEVIFKRNIYYFSDVLEKSRNKGGKTLYHRKAGTEDILFCGEGGGRAGIIASCYFLLYHN